jgi:hypothetical protein
VIGSILAATYRSSLHPTGVPGGLSGKARDSFAVALHAGGPIHAAAESAFVHGSHSALSYAAGIALAAGLGVAALLPRRHPRADTIRFGETSNALPAAAEAA